MQHARFHGYIVSTIDSPFFILSTHSTLHRSVPTINPLVVPPLSKHAIFPFITFCSEPAAACKPFPSMSHAPIARGLSPPAYYNKSVSTVDGVSGMQYIRLGSTGATVSRICLGCASYAQLEENEAAGYKWILHQQEAEKFIQQALDAGITFFDTSEAYNDQKSELFLGTTLRKLLPTAHFTRDDLFITTKIAPGRHATKLGKDRLQRNLSRKAILAAVDASLHRLQLDYVDMLMLHRGDVDTSPEEVMSALHDVVKSGKARYIGASSMYTWQFVRLQMAAERNGWTKFSVMQNQWNAVYREEERDMIPHCIDTGVAITPYSPLAAGILARLPDSEPTFRAQNDPSQAARFHRAGDDEVVAAIQAIAKSRGIPPSQVALAWLLGKQGVTAPIIGATKPHHIEDAVKALAVQLTAEEVKQIEDKYVPHAIVGQ